MKKILTDEQIGENLRSVIEAMGLTQDEFAEKIGKKKTHISGYIGNTGGRKAKNLLPELITLGINGLWFLTREGSMFSNEAQDKSGEASESEEALRSQAKAIQLMFDRGLIKINTQPELKLPESRLYPTECETYHGNPIPQESSLTIPVYTHTIAAGKPSESSCAIEEYITISACRVKHPKETYAVKAFGDSMKDAGILEGDLLIVDRAIEPLNNHIVIASINDEQTVKRLRVKKGAVSLVPENQNYHPIEITSEMDFRTLGVVTYVVRKTA